MTVDARAPEVPRPIDQPTSTRTSRLLAAAAGAPERLLLVFLWFCCVVALAYVSGLFRPLIVFPATLVVVVLTWRLYPRAEAPTARASTRDWGSAVGSLLCFAVAGTWFVLNLPYLSERVQVNRDPDIYTLTALWLLDHSSPSIPVHEVSAGSLGFSLVDGALGPQGNHLISGVSATAGWLFGEEAVFWGNLACAAAALVALYVLARQLLGPIWALLPVVALAGSMPMLEFSRALYSEPLAMTFTFLGASLLWRAWKWDSTTGYLLAGITFGAVALARIDGTLPLLGVLVGLTLAAFVHPGRNESRRRWAAPLVLLGSLPGVLLGFLDLQLHSGTYVEDLRGQLVMLTAGLVLSAVIGLVGAVIRVPEHRLGLTARILAHLATAGAVLGAVGFVVLASRPWWYVSHGEDDNGLVSQIQEREGLPIDGTRLYSEESFQWVSWYYGWPVVVVGLGGLLAWLIAGSRGKSTQLLWLAALFLPSAALYLTSPNITPDQIWAMRRFLPVAIPGMLLATVWVARALAARHRVGGVAGRVVGVILAAALAVSVVALPLTTGQELWAEKNNAGALDGNRQVCEQIAGRPVIVTGVDTYLPTPIILCDIPAVSVPNPTPRRLREAYDALGGGSVVLVTRAPLSVPWVDDAPPAPFLYEQTVWERSLSGPPEETTLQVIQITLGLVEPDGSVRPLTTGP